MDHGFKESLRELKRGSRYRHSEIKLNAAAGDIGIAVVTDYLSTGQSYTRIDLRSYYQINEFVFDRFCEIVTMSNLNRNEHERCYQITFNTNLACSYPNQLIRLLEAGINLTLIHTKEQAELSLPACSKLSIEFKSKPTYNFFDRIEKLSLCKLDQKTAKLIKSQHLIALTLEDKIDQSVLMVIPEILGSNPCLKQLAFDWNSDISQEELDSFCHHLSQDKQLKSLKLYSMECHSRLTRYQSYRLIETLQHNSSLKTLRACFSLGTPGESMIYQLLSLNHSLVNLPMEQFKLFDMRKDSKVPSGISNNWVIRDLGDAGEAAVFKDLLERNKLNYQRRKRSLQDWAVFVIKKHQLITRDLPIAVARQYCVLGYGGF